MLLQLIDLAGVAVFAVSGALAAGRKRLDLLGVVVIATVTAIGGGTLRDLLLDRPVFWVEDTRYLVVIVAAAFVTIAWTRRRRAPADALAIADALGLAFFVISGARIAQDAGLPAISVVIMGTITGVAGGVVRDVLTNEIPFILRRGELYATAAMAGIGLHLLLGWAGLPTDASALAGMAGVVALRLAAILWNVRLPVFTLPEE